MSQCVPGWDLDISTTRLNVPSMDYEVAELTWENGQLSMHGLRPPPLSTKLPPDALPRPVAGTLESLVNQATTYPPPPLNHRRPAAAIDALVPCKTNASVTESTPAATAGASTSLMWSPENTKTTSSEDHDSVSHSSRSQREGGEEVEVAKKKLKSGSGKSSASTKRIRAAAIHNQSERKRRDKINQRMKTLQKLVPNSSKTDKASILDEVIEYVKQLQAQVNTINRMNMMMPLQALHQQQLHMSMMAAAAVAAARQPHHVPVMDFNSLNHAAAAMSPPMMLPPPPFMPVTGPWDMQGRDIMSAFLATQSTQPQQPMTMDAYSRLATLYQQFQPGPGFGSGSKN